MGHAIRLIAVGAAAFALQGCLAKTAVSAVTLPVKVASSGVDMATTSQSEADQKRGREIRQREERLGKLQRDYDKQIDRLRRGRPPGLRPGARRLTPRCRCCMPSLPVEPPAELGRGAPQPVVDRRADAVLGDRRDRDARLR